ncbi:putative macrophage mannose receptor 1-like [Apostichopus japonicus]|uniref:Putative macrophage mannose receptor 1-like n=1 Tax=Stichopus japonicus TaxID=307972 RepID=A0A2G8KRX7_STIJA|nr:putative macrophage mannose receptor 1-like [Apostichopus japonicus]
MGKQFYREEANRLLGNPQHYKLLDSDPTQEITQNVKRVIQKIVSNGSIDRKLGQNLLENDPKPGRFYFLPKIHKEGNPGRPIISVTLDVSSLYTNIPNEEGISACTKAFKPKRGKTPTKKELAELMQLILTNNNLVFGNKHYLQIHGTAMDCFAYISSDDAEISPTTSYVDYERHSHCYYYVTKSVGHVVMVDLLEYEWEYHSSCLYDSIEVLNDTEIWSSVCGYSIPRQIQTTGFIYGFVINSDGVISRSGPVANVTTIPDSVFDSTELPTYANYATDINGFIDVEDNTCPHEWHYFDQSCYFIKTSAGEFSDAERYCGSHGGQLVSIHSDKEQRFIYSLLTSDVQSYYIGMRLYIDKDGYDGWENTDSTAINYTNWYPGMPDGGKHEDCVEIYYYHEGKWNDVSCRSSLNGAVCKADIDTVLSTHTVPQSVPTMTHCKDGWISYNSDNYYCFMENEKIWSAASRACERIGGHLLQVNSSYENEFIWTTMESIDAEFVWLGITDQADEGVWVTDDMRTPPEYTNWDSWEPNNLHNEDCAVMFLHWTGNLRRGAWYDNPCCHEFPFICEK